MGTDCSSFEPARVALMLSQHFCDPVTERPPTRMEKALYSRFKSILVDACNSRLDIDSETDNGEGESDSEDNDSDIDWAELDSRSSTMTDTPPEETCLMGNNNACTKEKMDQMLEYYRAPIKGSRSFASMKSKFYREIVTQNDLTRLRAYEARQEVAESRKNQYRRLHVLVKDAVLEKIDEGVALHDADIVQMAVQINADKKVLPSGVFTASPSWVSRFKKSVNLRCRHITRFVTRKNKRNQASIDASGDAFVSKISQKLIGLDPDEVWNGDQTGIVKESYSGRCLAIVGSKKVEAVAQSASALTHSYTALPMISLSGKLAKKLFIVLPEPNGLPRRGHWTADNIVVRHGKSHMMTKKHTAEWVSECVCAPGMPRRQLLLIDSWSGFKDTAALHAAARPRFQLDLEYIPPGTTWRCQPLDVFFNRQFKHYLKKLNSHVIALALDFQIANRDNMLKTVSQMYRQFSADRFRDCWKYAWYKAGYVTVRPPQFQTPSEWAFVRQPTPCHTPLCPKMSLIRCSHCEDFFCFMCMVAAYHDC